MPPQRSSSASHSSRGEAVGASPTQDIEPTSLRSPAPKSRCPIGSLPSANTGALPGGPPRRHARKNTHATHNLDLKAIEEWRRFLFLPPQRKCPCWMDNLELWPSGKCRRLLARQPLSWYTHSKDSSLIAAIDR